MNQKEREVLVELIVEARHELNKNKREVGSPQERLRLLGRFEMALEVRERLKKA